MRLFAFFFFIFSLLASPVWGDVVLWNSLEGLNRLERSEYKTDFYQLAGNFQPQINPLYCGIASSVIVLNAIRLEKGKAPNQPELEVQKPEVLGGDKMSYTIYSQQTFLNQETDKIKPRRIIDLKNSTPQNTHDEASFSPGLGLGDLGKMLRYYKTRVKIQYADQEPEKGSRRFRKVLKKVLRDKDHFLVANFYGKALGLKTGGHISPVAAYDASTDSLLLLDVAAHKNPWHWIPLVDFYKSMNTKGGNEFRGYLVVSE
ncbi:MAG: phytochelatin synthase family protein [bacterium]|nr:phytochelatin synthase family protein [bacterium]